MLEVSGLDLFYGDALALSDISLHADEAAIIAIIGANGAGKSSLIRTIAGIERPRRGSIRFCGQEIADLPPHIVCNLGLGQVAEGRQIFPNLTVADNLDVGSLVPRGRPHKRASLERVYHLFPRLKERAGQYAGTLSGGEQQMLAIGRCLMARPTLVMFDEPSLGLSPALVQQVFGTIKRLNEEGLTILLVEQNVAVSLSLATGAYVLENGQIHPHWQR
jgi:branched-chain amino acid transport system ATP-binding protein